jgi:hypothetical protein
MGTPLDRIRAKIDRAEHHLRDLQLADNAFRNSRPYAFDTKEDAQAGKRFYYVCKAEPVPDSYAAIAADVIHNLRAPLDHIAHALVDAGSGPKPEKIYFPICWSATKYPTFRAGNIKGVRQEVVDAIDATEPYKGGKGHALWQLNELNKPDKHKILLGAGGVGRGTKFGELLKRIAPDSPLLKTGLAEMRLRPTRELKPLNIGDVLLWEPLFLQVDENIKFTYAISFNELGVIECEPVLPTLHNMAKLVRRIVEELGRFLRA